VAGFELIISGRFWVIAKDNSLNPQCRELLELSRGSQSVTNYSLLHRSAMRCSALLGIT